MQVLNTAIFEYCAIIKLNWAFLRKTIEKYNYLLFNRVNLAKIISKQEK